MYIPKLLVQGGTHSKNFGLSGTVTIRLFASACSCSWRFFASSLVLQASAARSSSNCCKILPRRAVENVGYRRRSWEQRQFLQRATRFRRYPAFCATAFLSIANALVGSAEESVRCPAGTITRSGCWRCIESFCLPTWRRDEAAQEKTLLIVDR